MFVPQQPAAAAMVIAQGVAVESGEAFRGAGFGESLPVRPERTGLLSCRRDARGRWLEVVLARLTAADRTRDRVRDDPGVRRAHKRDPIASLP